MSLSVALAPSMSATAGATRVQVTSVPGRTTERRPRLRLTRRGRVVRSVLFIALGASAATMGANLFTSEADAAGHVVATSAVQAASSMNSAATGAVGGSMNLPQAYAIVEHGQSLWSIAAQRTAPGGDVRLQMKVIREANGIQGAHVFTGQVLLLPAVR